MASCDDCNILETLDNIKAVGNSEPKRAMLMYDSIRSQIENTSEYIKMKGYMLEMRLRDKAYMKANNSDSAKIITEFFDRRSDKEDAAEAHYYAGSVFRDIKDMPNALHHFLKAEDLTVSNRPCDSVMLVNIYSNLVYVYFCVQDYANALSMALKEYEVSKASRTLDVVTIIDVGENYLRLGDSESAYLYYKEALDLIKISTIGTNDYGSLYTLLYELSFMGKLEDAKECYNIIQGLKFVPPPLQLGEFYKLRNEVDSAIACYQSSLIEPNSLEVQYNASRNLFYIYKEIGNKDSICKYADLYIQMADSIDLGKRQEMAASVNNQYHYYRNVEEEARIKEANNRYKIWLYTAIVSSALILLFYYLHHTWRKNKHLKEMLLLTKQLTSARKGVDSLKEEIIAYRTQLNNSEQSLLKTKQELAQVNKDISHYEEELKVKEQQLVEKLEENKRFILLLHKADLEESAEDIVKAIRNASEGKYKMSGTEWQKFYHAVDELQPNLSGKLAHHLGKFTEQQQQVCYLLSIGLSNTQIENLTNIPHVTVWRWVKKFDWI